MSKFELGTKVKVKGDLCHHIKDGAVAEVVSDQNLVEILAITGKTLEGLDATIVKGKAKHKGVTFDTVQLIPNDLLEEAIQEEAS